MAHPLHCAECKRFAKTISEYQRRKTTYRILKCKNCGSYTLSRISYYLAVWGGMEAEISSRKIEKGGRLWKQHMERKKENGGG